MSNNPTKSFWKELGDSYQAFSTLSDEGDWQSIISQVASILALNTSTSKCVLDYGSGLGSTASSIRRRLYGDHGILSSWVLYDPDDFARKESHIAMPSISNDMKVLIIDSMPINQKIDVALFVHTTYYIDNFRRVLNRILDNFLDPVNGMIICVAMPSNSPFFISELGNHHNWCAESIVDIAKSIGLKSDIIQLRSRFRWLPNLSKDDVLSKLIATFVCGKKPISSEEIEIVRNRLVGEVDFGDWLITLKR